MQERKNSEITYGELLSIIEWRELRAKIIARDKDRCSNCQKKASEFYRGRHWRNYTPIELEQKREEVLERQEELNKNSILKLKVAVPIGGPVDSPVYLHVHHRYYILGKLPWEYGDDVLITFCDQCRGARTRNGVEMLCKA